MSNSNTIMRGGNWFRTEGDAGMPDLTDVTPNATAHTKGTYAQLVASSPGPTRGVILYLYQNGQGGENLVDVAVGAAASEVNIVEDLLFSAANLFSPEVLSLPLWLDVPAGSRISVRCQASGASAGAIRAGITLIGAVPGLPAGYRKYVGYGVNTGTTRGTTLAMSFGSKTAWAQLTASLPEIGKDVRVLSGNALIGSRGSIRHAVDLGIGAAASEVVLVDNLPYVSNSQEQVTPMSHAPLYTDIPAGTRLSVRQQTHTSSGVDTDFAILVGH